MMDFTQTNKQNLVDVFAKNVSVAEQEIVLWEQNMTS